MGYEKMRLKTWVVKGVEYKLITSLLMLPTFDLKKNSVKQPLKTRPRPSAENAH